MIRYFFHRLLVFVVRLVLAALVLVMLIEIGFCVFGRSDIHVWEVMFREDGTGVFGNSEWIGALIKRTFSSGFVILLAYGGGLLVGYVWGILGARLRRWKVASILSLPWAILACAPSFWFVICVAIFSFFEWKRPGFADDLVVATGADLLSWWNAAVVAVPLLAASASWQLKAVSGVIEKEATQPFVSGLFLSGYRHEDIFHKNILKRSRKELIGLFDRTLPAILGGLIVSEWAFHYEGMGSLVVESLNEKSYVGIFLSGMWMAAIIGLTALVRELLCQERSRLD